MIDQKLVSIIIPHLGATEEQEYAFDECWKSLNETVPDIKKIVVSNGDSLCSHNEISEIMISSQGQNKAVNAGVAITDTPWIFVTNDDMIYKNSWWDDLTIDLPENIMCISPKLIEPNEQHAPTFDYYFCGGAGGDFDKAKWLEFAKNYQGQGLRTGFNLPFLIKREVLDIIATYDVNYDPWGSNGDSDLQAKIHLAGVQPYQNTNCIVYHFSQTSGTGSPENRPYWQKNWDYFIFKWGFERQSSPKVWQSVDIIDYERLKYHPWWENWFKNR